MIAIFSVMPDLIRHPCTPICRGLDAAGGAWTPDQVRGDDKEGGER